MFIAFAIICKEVVCNKHCKTLWEQITGSVGIMLHFLVLYLVLLQYFCSEGLITDNSRKDGVPITWQK